MIDPPSNRTWTFSVDFRNYLHSHSSEDTHARRDVQHVKDDLLIPAEDCPAADHVEEGVADLTGSPGHHHLDRGLGSGRVRDCKGQTSV